MTKPKKVNKSYCSTCHTKHVPSTGKKCTIYSAEMSKNGSSKTTSASSVRNSSEEWDSQVMSASVCKNVRVKATKQKDYYAKKASASGGYSTDETSEEEECDHSSGVQTLILAELQCFNSRLDAMERTVNSMQQTQRHRHKTDRYRKHQLSNPLNSKQKYKAKSSGSKHDSYTVTSSSASSSENELPDLSYIRSSRDV